MKTDLICECMAVFIVACILVLSSTSWVFTQEIGNPLDTFKRERQENQKDFRDKPNVSAVEPKKLKITPGSRSKSINRSVVYKGYSKKFKNIKELMCQGKADEVQKLYAKEDQKTAESCKSEEELAKKIGYLGLLERGTMSVDKGDSKKAAQKFSYAEEILKDRKKESKVIEGAKKSGSFLLESLTGYEEIGPYWGEGYERVLMLNYKAIAYLLQGERKAYNVTRRAIDWQNMEKKAFDEKMRKVHEKLDEERKGQEKKGHDITKFNVEGILAEQFSAMDAKASTVDSAYVNPFGYYIAGMIQEFESYNDPSLRHNARISYEKALQLNPLSLVLQQAVEDLKKQPTHSATKLVHVVMGDGFVPEKKVLVFRFKIGDVVVPIKLPIYEPTPSQVHHIEVQTLDGKCLSILSPVADIEAICLRYQKDMQPFYTLRVTLALVRTFIAKKIFHEIGIFGQIFSAVYDEMAAPDTRSWMSLPASIQATRIHVPMTQKSLKIVTFNKEGNELATKIVNLDTSTHNFVYVRGIDNILYTYSNKKLWLTRK